MDPKTVPLPTLCLLVYSMCVDGGCVCGVHVCVWLQVYLCECAHMEHGPRKKKKREKKKEKKEKRIENLMSLHFVNYDWNIYYNCKF